MTTRRATGEAGLTLVELLVTIVIMGIAFAVLVGGLGTAVLGSDLHRKQAKVENLLRTFAETVKGSPYQDCATTDYAGWSFPTPAGYTAAVTKVEFAPPPFSEYQGDCKTQLREPNKVETTSFSNPANAYVIGEAPTPLTADASLQVGTAPTATITLRGYGSVPTNATLRVVHRESAGAAEPTLTVNGTAHTLQKHTAALGEDPVAVGPSAGDLTVTYTASLASASLTGSDALDGIWLQYTDADAPDPGLQRVTLEVTAKSRPVTQDVQVVLRRRDT